MVLATFDVLPAIDLRAGRVVRLLEGDFGRETAYAEEPLEVARTMAAAGAGWVHVVDLDAARTGEPRDDGLVDAIVAALPRTVRVQVAGGIRNEAIAAARLAAGAARIVVGTAALEDPAFAERLVRTHGSERVAAAIDVRAGKALGGGWVRGAAGVDAFEAIARLADAGITTFAVTAIERDGGLRGPDLDLLERAVALRRGNVLASGGVASLDDLRRVRDLGCDGAIVGRAIYEGRLDLGAAIRWSRDDRSLPGG